MNIWEDEYNQMMREKSYEQQWDRLYQKARDPVPSWAHLVRAVDQLIYAVHDLREVILEANPPGHQAPGSREVELPKDDGYAAKLPKR